MTHGPDAPPTERRPLAWAPPEKSGESTDPDFPSASFSEPPRPADLRAGPRPELVWSPPPPPPPTPATALDRAAAGVVDAAVVLAILALTTVLTSLVLSRGLHWLYRDESASGVLLGTNALAIPLLVAVPVVAAICYCALVPGMAGATLGMRLVGLRLRRDAPGGPRAGARLALVRLVFFAAGSALLALGPLSLLWDPGRRAWHDRASGTVVAHR